MSQKSRPTKQLQVGIRVKAGTHAGSSCDVTQSDIKKIADEIWGAANSVTGPGKSTLDAVINELYYLCD